jgi:hypothetical protein
MQTSEQLLGHAFTNGLNKWDYSWVYGQPLHKRLTSLILVDPNKAKIKKKDIWHAKPPINRLTRVFY